MAADLEETLNSYLSSLEELAAPSDKDESSAATRRNELFKDIYTYVLLSLVSSVRLL